MTPFLGCLLRRAWTVKVAQTVTFLPILVTLFLSNKIELCDSFVIGALPEGLKSKWLAPKILVIGALTKGLMTK